MCTHNTCFEQKYENSQIISTENFHFCSREKSLYIAWACFRYDIVSLDTSFNYSNCCSNYRLNLDFLESEIQPLYGQRAIALQSSFQC